MVVSGPSGVGKSTVVRALLERMPHAWLSISATSRPPRPGEVDGVVGGVVVGAIGVSGSTVEDDHAVAEAAVAAVS